MVASVPRGGRVVKAVKAALLHPNGAKMSDAQIAEYVGVSQPMVGKYRNELAATNKDFQSSQRTGRDGRTINTAKIGKKKCRNCGGTENQTAQSCHLVSRSKRTNFALILQAQNLRLQNPHPANDLAFRGRKSVDRGRNENR